MRNKVAILGTGFLARTRARCWRRVFGAEFAVICASRDGAKAATFAREHGLAGACAVDEALADPGVALVDLCVPNRAHRELCERAARAGKDVLCTKPLAAFWGEGSVDDRAGMFARAVDEADAMVAACAKAGVRLFYGENWCFAPAITRAAALARASADITAGAIVEMRGWESHSGSHSPYAKEWSHAGGGALLRLGAHPIGAMLWLKRGAARAVSVTAEVRAEGGAPESWGSCTIKFSDGSVGVALGSDHMLGGMQSHLTVLSPAFRFECSLSPIDTLRAYAPRDGAFGSEYIMEKVDGQAGWSTPIPDEDWSSGQQGLVQSVADALRTNAAPTCDGALGAEVVRVVYAAYVSAAEGRRVVL